MLFSGTTLRNRAYYNFRQHIIQREHQKHPSARSQVETNSKAQQRACGYHNSAFGPYFQAVQTNCNTTKSALRLENTHTVQTLSRLLPPLRNSPHGPEEPTATDRQEQHPYPDVPEHPARKASSLEGTLLALQQLVVVRVAVL